MAEVDPAEQDAVTPLPRPVGPSVWRMRDPRKADPTGLVGIGADLEPETLVDAYWRGIFPWPHHGTALPWFSPDPRAVIVPSGIRLSRSLCRRLRNCGWETTMDTQFDAVVAACARRAADEGTWITDDMRRAYGRLHRLGWAHSIEVWPGPERPDRARQSGSEGPELLGGLYGVAVGACFTGESMFHRATDASKVALADFVDRWQEAGGELFDVQLPTEHLRSLGAVEMPREDFLTRLDQLRERRVSLPLGRRNVTRLAR